MGGGQCVGLEVIWAQQGAPISDQMEGLLGSTQLLGTKKELGERRPNGQRVP